MSSKRAKKTAGERGPLWRTDTAVGLAVMLLALALLASTDLFSGLERRFYDGGVASSDRLPSNTMFDLATQSVNVTDSGIARVTDASRIVMSGHMSPEQLAGDSMATLMDQIANQSAPGVRNVRPESPQALADILDRRLVKSPDARFQTGAELSSQLREVLGADLRDTHETAAHVAADDASEKTRAWAPGREDATTTTAFEATKVMAQTNTSYNNNSAGLRGRPNPPQS